MASLKWKPTPRAAMISAVVVIVLAIAGLVGFPAYLRVEKRLNAKNDIELTKTQIRNAQLQITLAQQNAVLGMINAKATEEQQLVLNKMLTPLSIQYFTTQALKAFAASGSHSVVYIPADGNGVSLNPTAITNTIGKP